MSSLRNAVKRITHKERGQPQNRKKFGLLEKHKDYIERARDFQNKEKFIKSLKKKAAERNPDEFYFKMHNSQVVDGVHEKRGESEVLSNEDAKHYKLQDYKYLLHSKILDDRKIEKLEESLHNLSGSSRQRNHTIFVDDSTEVQRFDPATHFQTDERFLDRAYNRPRQETIERQAQLPIPSREQRKKVSKSTKRAYEELKERKKRSVKLSKIVEKLTTQRNVMGKGSKKKIEIVADGKTKHIFKWKRVRQK